MNEVQKTQEVRLFDVFIIGPFLMYMGMKSGKMTSNEQIILALFGLGTILYNGKNYFEQREQQ